MKGLVWCLLAAAPLAAMSNAVLVNDATGGGVARPVTIPRLFMRGEFPAGRYPKPRAGGVTPASWQVDVKSTWPDGSVMMAYVSLPVTVPANGSVAVDFVADASPCHLGSAAACQGAALDQAAMVGFMGGNWDFVLKGTAGSVTNLASARAMIGAGAWSYWLRGPVVTRVLVEDVSRPSPAFDFGWYWDGSGWQAPPSNNYKSVHPMFMVSFYPSYTAGVEAEVMAWNNWTSRLQRQVFDLEVQTYGGAVQYSKAGFDLAARTRFTRLVWSGVAPGAVQIDFNLVYMIATRIIPPMDTTKPVSAAAVNGRLSAYAANLGADDPQSCSNATYCGSWLKYLPNTGGRPDLGLMPAWYADALFTMGDPGWAVADRLNVWNKLLVGNADAALTAAMGLRELDNSTSRDDPSDGRRYYFNYDKEQVTPAWGRIVTVESRPTMRTYANYEQTQNDVADRLTLACSAAPCHGGYDADSSLKKGWTMDNGHWPSFFAIPYLLTGRYSYLLALEETAAAWMFWPDPTCERYGLRCYEWGIIAQYGNFRNTAWPLREVAWAAFLAPDGPEREFFQDALLRHDEFFEGTANVLGGNARATGDCAPAVSTGGYSTTITSSSGGDGNAISSFKTNGARKVFCTYRWPFLSAPSVTVSGAGKTVGIRGVDSGKDWYYTPGGVCIWQDGSGTPPSSTDTVTIAYTGGKPPTYWCSGRHLGAKENDGLPTYMWTSEYFPEGVSADTDRMYRGFMLSYWFDVIGWIRSAWAVVHPATGKPAFFYYGKKLAEFAIGRFHTPDFPPYYSDQYTMPFNRANSVVPSTWAEYALMYYTDTTLDAAIGPSDLSFVVPVLNNSSGAKSMALFSGTFVRIEDEWVKVCGVASGTPAGKTTVTVCSGGRGYFGTAAVSHAAGVVVKHIRHGWNGDANGHSYPNLVAGTIAMLADADTAAGSGLSAWEKAWVTLKNLDARVNEEQWNLVPYPGPRNVRAYGTAGTLALYYSAPDLGACRFAASTAFATPEDSGDTEDGGGSRARRVVVSGLPAGTYQYRITCGAGRVVGTATVP